MEKRKEKEVSVRLQEDRLLGMILQEHEEEKQVRRTGKFLKMLQAEVGWLASRPELSRQHEEFTLIPFFLQIGILRTRRNYLGFSGNPIMLSSAVKLDLNVESYGDTLQ